MKIPIEEIISELDERITKKVKTMRYRNGGIAVSAIKLALAIAKPVAVLRPDGIHSKWMFAGNTTSDFHDSWRRWVARNEEEIKEAAATIKILDHAIHT